MKNLPHYFLLSLFVVAAAASCFSYGLPWSRNLSQLSGMLAVFVGLVQILSARKWAKLPEHTHGVKLWFARSAIWALLLLAGAEGVLPRAFAFLVLCLGVEVVVHERREHLAQQKAKAEAKS